MLSADTARRLRSLIPVFASNHDGEVVAAVRAVDRLLRSEDRTCERNGVLS